MAGPTAAELQAALDATLQDVTNARAGVDSAVAFMASLRQQVDDAMANAVDLTEAKATVAKIFAKHQENAQALADGMAAPGGP